MDVEAAKLIGTGLAIIGLPLVGIGISNVFSAFITSVGRNPATRTTLFPIAMLGFALVEAIALFAMLIAFLILFG